MLVYLLFVIGLAVLLLGGDLLVKGAVGLAEKFGISPLIIGLTIVALGTSAPELLISLSAALTGNGGLAVGNVVGSNIANVLLVLGVPALLAKICCGNDDVNTTLLFLIGLTALFMMQMGFGPVSRLDGLILLICLFAFLARQYMAARNQSKTQLAEATEDIHDEVGTVPTNLKTIALLIGFGLIALPLGASLAVNSAVEIATRWDIPKEIIGLTVVAIGTSLPELATGVMAARQGNASVAIGNVVGSNLYNIAAIMGFTATIAGPIAVSNHMIFYDMWVMLAATLFLIALIVLNITITKRMGSLMVIGYFAYLVSTSVT